LNLKSQVRFRFEELPEAELHLGMAERHITNRRSPVLP
jgi:hypothetical protein